MNNNSYIFFNRGTSHALVVSLLVALTGCAQETTEKKATQVAAVVNDTEITVHQINHILQTSGVAASEDAPKKVLDGLIDQELFVQKAISNHLDRDPNVMMTLENARKQILSQSYIQRQVLDKTPIDTKAKRDYFEQNPDLFSKRRVYQFQIFNLDIEKIEPSLNAELEKVSTPDQVKTLLTQHNIKFQDESVAKPAEQLPIEMLGTLAKSKIGDVVILPQNTKVLLMQVTNVADRPVTFEQAENQIEQFLTNTQNKKTLDAHLEQLRKVAKIEYQGDFAEKDKTQKTDLPTEVAPTSDTKSDDKQKILESGFK